jgi:hypothetical protein
LIDLYTRIRGFSGELAPVFKACESATKGKFRSAFENIASKRAGEIPQAATTTSPFYPPESHDTIFEEPLAKEL